jgi:hypothetical protein
MIGKKLAKLAPAPKVISMHSPEKRTLGGVKRGSDGDDTTMHDRLMTDYI